MTVLSLRNAYVTVSILRGLNSYLWEPWRDAMSWRDVTDAGTNILTNY